MNEFLVSIDICSPKHTLSELSALTGVDAGKASHEKDAPRGRRGTWPETILRLESRIPLHAAAKEHVADVLSRFEGLGVYGRLAGNIGIQLHLNVAVIFSTANVSIEIDACQLAVIGRLGMHLAFSAYPGSDEMESHEE